MSNCNGNGNGTGTGGSHTNPNRGESHGHGPGPGPGLGSVPTRGPFFLNENRNRRPHQHPQPQPSFGFHAGGGGGDDYFRSNPMVPFGWNANTGQGTNSNGNGNHGNGHGHGNRGYNDNGMNTNFIWNNDPNANIYRNHYPNTNTNHNPRPLQFDNLDPNPRPLFPLDFSSNQNPHSLSNLRALQLNSTQNQNQNQNQNHHSGLSYSQGRGSFEQGMRGPPPEHLRLRGPDLNPNPTQYQNQNNHNDLFRGPSPEHLRLRGPDFDERDRHGHGHGNGHGAVAPPHFRPFSPPNHPSPAFDMSTSTNINVGIGIGMSMDRNVQSRSRPGGPTPPPPPRPSSANANETASSSTSTSTLPKNLNVPAQTRPIKLLLHPPLSKQKKKRKRSRSKSASASNTPPLPKKYSGESEQEHAVSVITSTSAPPLNVSILANVEDWLQPPNPPPPVAPPRAPTPTKEEKSIRNGNGKRTNHDGTEFTGFKSPAKPKQSTTKRKRPEKRKNVTVPPINVKEGKTKSPKKKMKNNEQKAKVDVDVKPKPKTSQQPQPQLLPPVPPANPTQGNSNKNKKKKKKKDAVCVPTEVLSQKMMHKKHKAERRRINSRRHDISKSRKEIRSNSCRRKLTPGEVAKLQSYNRELKILEQQSKAMNEAEKLRKEAGVIVKPIEVDQAGAHALGNQNSLVGGKPMHQNNTGGNHNSVVNNEDRKEKEVQKDKDDDVHVDDDVNINVDDQMSISESDMDISGSEDEHRSIVHVASKSSFDDCRSSASSKSEASLNEVKKSMKKSPRDILYSRRSELEKKQILPASHGLGLGLGLGLSADTNSTNNALIAEAAANGRALKEKKEKLKLALQKVELGKMKAKLAAARVRKEALQKENANSQVVSTHSAESQHEKSKDESLHDSSGEEEVLGDVSAFKMKSLLITNIGSHGLEANIRFRDLESISDNLNIENQAHTYSDVNENVEDIKSAEVSNPEPYASDATASKLTLSIEIAKRRLKLAELKNSLSEKKHNSTGPTPTTCAENDLSNPEKDARMESGKESDLLIEEKIPSKADSLQDLLERKKKLLENRDKQLKLAELKNSQKKIDPFEATENESRITEEEVMIERGEESKVVISVAVEEKKPSKPDNVQDLLKRQKELQESINASREAQKELKKEQDVSSLRKMINKQKVLLEYHGSQLRSCTSDMKKCKGKYEEEKTAKKQNETKLKDLIERKAITEKLVISVTNKIMSLRRQRERDSNKGNI